MRVFPDELAVFIHAHAVGIGNDPDFSGDACRVLSDVHLGSHLEHGRNRIGLSGLCILPHRTLSGIDRRRGFGISEHVADAVVTDPVAAAEIAVRIIVGETPAERSRDIPFGTDGFKHVRVTDRLFLHGALAEKGRGRIHVTVILADQVRLRHVGRDIFLLFTAGVRTAVQEVIIGIDVLEQTAFFQVTDAAGRAGRVELVSSRVRSGIERVVVLRFIDPDAPENDRRMVSILQDHLACVFHDLFLPGVVTQMLPAGDLREHQQADLVAAIDEMPRLRVMRRADRVQAELVLQNVRVASLHALRHGIADVRKALVAVQAGQLDPSAVQIKTVGLPLGLAETEYGLGAVNDLSLMKQFRDRRVEDRLFDIPEFRAFGGERAGHRAVSGGDELIRDLSVFPVRAGKYTVSHEKRL